MNGFEFYNPTRVIFGPGKVCDTGVCAALYGKKALVVTSRGSTVKLGIYDKVAESLKKAGVESVAFPGVDPNPRLSTVLEGARFCRENRTDLIVAVGGGSVIDCAKAISVAVFDSGDVWDVFTLKRQPEKALPVVAVLTISGTGSEMNGNCVITHEKLAQKYVAKSALFYPRISIIDPELMVSVPRFLTACGMVDTLTHVLEKYFDGTQGVPLQDRLSEGIVWTVLENEDILDCPDDVNKRGILAWASALALNGICDAGRGKDIFKAHAIELEVSAKYDVAHGAGLAAVFPSWMKHLCGTAPDKFAHFAHRIFGIRSGSALEAGLEGIRALREKFRFWGMPVTLKEMGVRKTDLEAMAEAIMNSPNGVRLRRDDILKVFDDCYE